MTPHRAIAIIVLSLLALGTAAFVLLPHDVIRWEYDDRNGIRQAWSAYVGPDGSLNFVDTGGHQIRASINNLFQPITTPEQYGAKGDGVTDDAAAFTTMCNAVNAAGGGHIVFGSVKNYLLENIDATGLLLKVCEITASYVTIDYNGSFFTIASTFPSSSGTIIPIAFSGSSGYNTVIGSRCVQTHQTVLPIVGNNFYGTICNYVSSGGHGFNFIQPSMIGGQAYLEVSGDANSISGNAYGFTIIDGYSQDSVYGMTAGNAGADSYVSEHCLHVQRCWDGYGAQRRNLHITSQNTLSQAVLIGPGGANNTATGTRTDQSTTLTGVSDTSLAVAGTGIVGTGIPVGTEIISKTASTIVMSRKASGTASGVTFTFGMRPESGDHIVYTVLPRNDGSSGAGYLAFDDCGPANAINYGIIENNRIFVDIDFSGNVQGGEQAVINAKNKTGACNSTVQNNVIEGSVRNVPDFYSGAAVIDWNVAADAPWSTETQGGNVLALRATGAANFHADMAPVLTTNPMIFRDFVLPGTRTFDNDNAAARVDAMAVVGGVVQPLPVLAGGTGDVGAVWPAYTPTVTCGNAGSLTTSSIAGHYRQIGKAVDVDIKLTITTNGTCATYLLISAPTAAVTGTNYTITGSDNGITGNLLRGLVGNIDASHFYVTDYKNAYPATDGSVLSLNGRYQAN